MNTQNYETLKYELILAARSQRFSNVYFTIQKSGLNKQYKEIIISLIKDMLKSGYSISEIGASAIGRIRLDKNIILS